MVTYSFHVFLSRKVTMILYPKVEMPCFWISNVLHVETVPLPDVRNLSGQEWLGILQLLPNLFKHLNCNRRYSSQVIRDVVDGLEPGEQFPCCISWGHGHKCSSCSMVVFEALISDTHFISNTVLKSM